MKVILTGSTGFIGKEVLHQSLQNPHISSVVVISRRDLPEYTSANNPKLKVIVHEDFLSYPDHVLKELEGAEACIWCLGLVTSSNLALARTANLKYALAAVSAFTTHLAPPLANQGKKFRFCYTSGTAAVKDQEKHLWVMQDYRRMRGELELRLVDLSTKNPSLELFIFRPSFVLSKEPSILHRALFAITTWFVGVDHVGAILVEAAVNGNKRVTQFTERGVVVPLGRALLLEAAK